MAGAPATARPSASRSVSGAQGTRPAAPWARYSYSIASTVDAMRLGADNYVTKPADADDILAAFSLAEQPVFAGAGQTFQPLSLARSEWEHVHRVLADCGGNVSEAARLLGIHRRSLQRKLLKRTPD